MLLKILFEDDYFIAINKPPGLLVHPSILDRRERKFAVQILSEQSGHQVWPIHRLDKGTSGVLLFAKTREATSRTSILFQENLVKKKYFALVRGYSEEGTIDRRIKTRKDKFLKAKNKEWDALTHYKTLSRIEIPYPVDIYETSRYSLVALFPETGRRHQLRQHMNSLKHPIIGDRTYGQRVHNDFFKNHYQWPRLFLASVELNLLHPFTGEPLKICSDPGEEFTEMIEKFWPGEKFQ